MTTGSIKDTRIRLRPSKQLLQLIEDNKAHMTEVPDNLAKMLKLAGCDVPAKIEVLKEELEVRAPKIDMELLAKLNGKMENIKEMKLEADAEKMKDEENETKQKAEKEIYLYLSDLRWLNNWLARLRKEQGLDVYLHNIVETCSLELPGNEVLKRNPELEARCQRLREEQQNRDYMKMTKNVDSSLKFVPEDTIAYQMKALNSQIIAVLQFVFSVAAGFVFGFLGIELIIGNLDFGLRLLLGIMFALIIALAEIYFLAKKLNEYDNAIATLNEQCTPVKKKKAHVD